MEAMIHFENDQRHTEDVQEIIDAPPRWLIRWGITICAAVLLIIISMSAILKYPDVVSTKVVIHPLDPPLVYSIDQESKVIRLLARNDQIVERGEVLAIIENSKTQTALIAEFKGRLAYTGIINENQILVSRGPLFKLHKINTGFYGEIFISDKDLDRVNKGSLVNLKVKGGESLGPACITGRIGYIVENARKPGYVAQVIFDSEACSKLRQINRNDVSLKADILTTPKTVLKRISETMFSNMP